VADGSTAGWCLAYLLYGNKIPAPYFPYFFNIGPGLLLLLAIMGLLALVFALTNAFGKRWRRALAWFLLCVFSGGSCVLGYFPVVLVVGASIADDGRQNE
jgi:hypothetical protein